MYAYVISFLAGTFALLFGVNRHNEQSSWLKAGSVAEATIIVLQFFHQITGYRQQSKDRLSLQQHRHFCLLAFRDSFGLITIAFCLAWYY